MYYLMNKNEPVLAFEPRPKSSFSDEVMFSTLKIENDKLRPLGFEDINLWIEGRKASKHNAHLNVIMKQLGCEDNEGFIKITHAASINDTFWIKSDKENIQWNDVSLYRNQFSETISKLAFEGLGLYEEIFSSTSPELCCDGSFLKCFTKENQIGENDSDIFLYKRGSVGNGFELYCEVMASEIAKHISPNAVSYEFAMLHGKLASKCNLFTNEEYGYASYAKVADTQIHYLEDAFNYFSELGSEQTFREMLVVDSLCFNQDRHAGNYGVLFDNNTLNVVKISPIFDLNLTLLPVAKMEDFEHIGDKLFEYAPKLGTDFTRIGQIGMNDIIRDKVKDIKDFSFTFRGDDFFPEERVKAIEEVVRKQATAILSQDKLYTKDVFFSQKAADLEIKREKVAKASAMMNSFENVLENTLKGRDVFISYCDSSDTVQIYIEKGSYEISLDFIKGKINVLGNAQPISFSELRQVDEELWEIGKAIKKDLKHFVKGKNTPFAAMFDGSEH